MKKQQDHHHHQQQQHHQHQLLSLPMRAYIRFPSGHLTLPSPPASPRHSSPRLRYGRSKTSGRIHHLHGGTSPLLPSTPSTFLQRVSCLFLSILLRRHGLFLLAPLIYISGMLFYMGTASFDGPAIARMVHPGSLYRSPDVFKALWPEMQNDSSSLKVATVWQIPKERECWKPCIKHMSSSKGLQESNGFIIIEANGGLNQQRSSICNAVAVAGLLNATLVIPSFHLNSVWQDPSKFGDIYDEDYFINSLTDNVRVVRQLPDYIMESVGNNVSLIYNFKIKAWAPASFYLEAVLPKLLETGVIRISPFANRLSFDQIPQRIQQLRCYANFESLRFAKPIAEAGKLLVDRMMRHSVNNNGKYIAVHLRFEEDMVAFSCCIYDGGEDEKRELDAARERGWRGKFNRTGRVINPGAIRMDGKCPLTPLEKCHTSPQLTSSFKNQNRIWCKHQLEDGKCPLTPLEVGMILRGMGFQNNTPIFLAAGKIYKAEKNMAPLRQMFPYLQTKESLLLPEELEPFQNYSSRLAALDYTVCLHSEVFVTTQGGNFPHFLIGHRRYSNNGHSKTIKPDKRKLAVVLDSPDLSWASFSRQMQAMLKHSDFKGHELRKPSASIYTYPAPDCMCSHKDNESTIVSIQEAGITTTNSSVVSLPG